jgi:hypothetical protein
MARRFMGDADDRASSPRRSWLLPAPADIVFGLTLLSAAIIRGWQMINTDGDLGRHLRVGREILAHGLFYTDRFSWTMQGQPFVPYEWGSEVLFALAHRVAGLPGVVAMTALVIALAYFCLMVLLERLGVDPLLAFATAIAAIMLGSAHWLARPHVFSLIAVVGVMALLEVTSRDSRVARPVTRDPRLLLTLALFGIWANLHGGFLFGLVLIGFYIVGDGLELVLDPSRPGLRVRLLRRVALLGAALVGSCVNPSGPRILPHVMGYLGKTWLVDMTVEYRSPDFHGAYGREFLAVLLLAVLVIALARRRMPWPRLVAFLGTAAFALHSMRNIPLWALTGLPLAALHADSAWRAVTWRPVAQVRGAFARGAQLARAGLWAAGAVLVLLVLAGGNGRIGSAQLLPERFDPAVFPVRVVERARAAHVTGRLFNELAWGGYILNAWPEQRVFIDGQTDFYGEPLSRLYASLRAAEPGWESRLDSLRIALVLIPDDARLAQALTSKPAWSAVDSTDGARLFVRAR